MTVELSRPVSARQDRTRAVMRTTGWLRRRGYEVLVPAGGPWHLIGISADHVVAIWTSTKWPSRRTLANLSARPAASWIRRLIVRWPAGKATPEVQEIEERVTMTLETPARHFAFLSLASSPRVTKGSDARQ